MTQVIDRRQVFGGKIFKVEEVDLDFENGKKATFEVVKFKVVTGVTALPIIRDEVILIKHYQVGIDAEGYSLPTGGLNQGENPYERMNQELMEEIGMRSQDLSLMTRANAMPGYVGSEAAYLFLARDLVSERMDGDEHYSIKIERMPVQKAVEMIKKQEITDLRTVAALLWYERFVKGGGYLAGITL